MFDNISSQIGVKIHATPDVYDTGIILYVKNRPVAEILNKILQHFDWSMRREGTIYEVFQSEEAKRRERMEFQRWSLLPYRRAQRVLSTTLDKYSFQNQPDAVANLRRLREPFISGQGWIRMPTEEQSKEFHRYQILANPLTNISAKIYTELGDAELKELADGGRIVYSTSPHWYQHRIPARHFREFTHAISYIGKLMEHFRDKPNHDGFDLHDADILGIRYNGTLDLDDVREVKLIILSTGITTNAVYYRLPRFVVHVISKSGHATYWIDFRFDDYPGTKIRTVPPDSELSVLSNRAELDAPFVPAYRLPEPPKDSWGRGYRGEPRWLTELAPPRNHFQMSARRSKALQKIAMETGLSLIADNCEMADYSDTSYLFGKTARQILTEFCEEGSNTGMVSNGWITLRKPDRALLKASELAPLRSRELIERANSGNWGIGWIRTVTSLFSDRQYAGAYFGSLARIPRPLREQFEGVNRYAARFLATLSPAVLRSLQSGGKLIYSRLDPRQRAIISALIQRSESGEWGLRERQQSRIYDPTLRGLRDNVFRVRAPKGDPNWESDDWYNNRDCEAATLLPQGPPDDTIISFKSWWSSAIETKSNGYEYGVTSLEAAAQTARGMPGALYRPAFVEKCALIISLKKNLTIGAVFAIGQKPGTGEFVPAAKLPKPIADFLLADPVAGIRKQ